MRSLRIYKMDSVKDVAKIQLSRNSGEKVQVRETKKSSAIEQKRKSANFKQGQIKSLDNIPGLMKPLKKGLKQAESFKSARSKQSSNDNVSEG